MTAIRLLKGLMFFIAVFHLAMGLGLMFSQPFQEWAVTLYGAEVLWTEQSVYFVRVVGSFAFALGLFAAAAARTPMRHPEIILGFVAFFVLRCVQRHLYSDELHAGFGLSPAMNALTSVFFLSQAIAAAMLLRLSMSEVPERRL